MNIAFILPSLANKGPIIVAYDLCVEFIKLGHECMVFYFDEICEVQFPCQTQRITYTERVDFSSFDVVHSHMFRPDLYLSLRKSLCAMVPIVSTLHQHIGKQFRFGDSSKPFFPFFKWLWFLALRKFDRVIALNDSHKTYYECYKIKVQSICNGRRVDLSKGVDLADTDVLEQFKSRYLVLGAIAFTTKRKGLDQIVKILVKLPQCGFLLVGDGPEVANLKNLARDLGVADRCLFLGKRNEGYRYFKYIDIFTLPSFAEGFPLSLIESFACGVPAVCSQIDEITSVLSQTDASFFKLNDEQSLLDAIERVMSDLEDSKERVMDMYAKRFSPSVMAERYIETYKGLIDRKS